MWRAFFFAVGAMMVIVGIECLLIDSATFVPEQGPVPINDGWLQKPQGYTFAEGKTVKPQEFVPWSLIASGTVIILYAASLPKRWEKDRQG